MVDGMHRNASVSWRSYENGTDKDQIVQMCKNVYEGTDVLPHTVSLLAEDDRCLPMVATQGQEVIAFFNLRMLETDDDTKDVVYIEKVRVLENMRRKGVATALMQEAMIAGKAWCDSERCTRFLSTTTPCNMAMQTVFKKAGWAYRGVVEIWPSVTRCNEVIRKTRDIQGRFLGALQLSKYMPNHALESVSSWRKLETSNEVCDTIQLIHEHGGCLLKPGYHAVETVRSAAENSMKQKETRMRSVWKLERSSSPPVLLFIQKAHADLLDPLTADSLSACVVDVTGAEACVAFAASLRDLGAFQISFDPAITKDMMKSSALLSQVPTTPFSVYEALK